MSLFGSIQMGKNTLQAQQVGLQVVGQNIANANTPGYSREEVLFEPQPTQKLGRLLLGLGVGVKGVVQVIDKFLEQRLRSSNSDLGSSETREQTYQQLESIVSELGDRDLSTSLNKFFGSIAEILNQPESAAVRNLAVLQGDILAGDIRRLAERAITMRTDLNDRTANMAQDIDRLLEQARKLNIQITSMEGSDTSGSEAVGLRDQRNKVLTELSKMIDIRVEEQPSGSTNIYLGGDFLVFEGTRRHVETSYIPASGYNKAEVRIIETDSALQATSGELKGLVTSRDEVITGFLDNLDSFSATLIGEFNKVFSSGQGLRGYSTLTSEFSVTDTTLPLDAVGLQYTPGNGSFFVKVHNKQTGAVQTTEIRVDLNGLDNNDTTMDNMLAQLNAVNGISASVSLTGKLTLSSDSPNLEFAFADDTSGILAALGVNTFFSGTSALDIGINSLMKEDPTRFAASKTGIAEDTENAILLADFLEQPLDSANGDSLKITYDRFIGEMTQGSSVAKSVADGFRSFNETLKGQQMATSGVSLDEETVRMISYQQAYQASAKFISTISELLEVLVNL